MKRIVTFEEAANAAKQVREYINKGESCRGPEWVNETFFLAETLENWTDEWYDDNFKKHYTHDDFIEETEFIHNASTYNWHMYEDID